MEPAAEKLHSYRKRVARIVRRAECDPERGAPRLRDEIDALLLELKRLARPEPAVVLEVLLLLLERVPEAAGRIDARERFLAEVLPAIIERARRILVRDGTAGAQKIDRNRAFQRLFALWSDDEEGDLVLLGPALLDAAVTPGDAAGLRLLLQEKLQALPLPFPGSRGDEADLGHVLLVAERHRVERMLGELLARDGRHDFAITVARDHYRRTGDALDFVQALRRAGRHDDAISVARRALSSPRSFQREAMREILDDLLAGLEGPAGDRDRKRALEDRFICDPGLKTFRAFKASVPSDQWPRVRKRVLGHLHKHQKAPTLLFNLYLEEGDVLEADGLAVTQPVEAQDLEVGAYRLGPEHGDKAAGWLLIAAHRRAQEHRIASDHQAVRDLLDVRELARRRGEEASFLRALRRLRERFARRRRFLRLLDAAGLDGAASPSSDGEPAAGG